MSAALLGFATGVAVGVIFTALRLPAPAPPTIPAVLGVVGIWVGMVLVRGIVGGP